MNALTTITTTNTTLTMSSREIAELTGKLHKNVMADIRKMLEELGLMSADFSAHMKVLMPRGGFRTEEVFNLPKDLTITLVSGYNVQMRYAITKRWMELEAQQAPRIPTNFAEALRLAAEVEEKRVALALENEKLKPLASVGGAVAARVRDLSIMDFARKLDGINTMSVRKTLHEKGYLKRVQNHYGSSQAHPSKPLGTNQAPHREPLRKP